MKLFLLAILFFPYSVSAAVVEFTPADSFVLGTIEPAAANQVLIGELRDFPHTWEFLVTEPTVFSAQLSVRPDGNQRASLIIIREEKRGVSEVGRRTGKDQEWVEYQDDVSELAFTRSDALTVELAAGVYRLEVSSPKNQGQYRLDINQTDSLGYLESLGQIVQLHSYFGIGLVGAVVTWQVYVPLLVLMFVGYWCYRRKHHA